MMVGIFYYYNFNEKNNVKECHCRSFHFRWTSFKKLRFVALGEHTELPTSHIENDRIQKASLCICIITYHQKEVLRCKNSFLFLVNLRLNYYG